MGGRAGHQEGVATGYTRRGLKPCQRPLIAALAEPKMIAGYALRSGNTACVNGAAEFLRATLRRLPAEEAEGNSGGWRTGEPQVRVGLVRGDSGFGDASMQDTAEELGLKFIFVARLSRPVQALCRHDDAHWSDTEVAGIQVQEIEHERPGRRLILLRTRIAERPQSGGKTLLEVPGFGKDLVPKTIVPVRIAPAPPPVPKPAPIAPFDPADPLAIQSPSANCSAPTGAKPKTRKMTTANSASPSKPPSTAGHSPQSDAIGRAPALHRIRRVRALHHHARRWRGRFQSSSGSITAIAGCGSCR